MFPKRSISICSTTEPTRKKNTIKTCDFVHRRFTGRFGQRNLASISQEEVLEFLLAMTKDNRQATKQKPVLGTGILLQLQHQHRVACPYQSLQRFRHQKDLQTRTSYSLEYCR